jgi:hypothetical protein
VKVCAKRARWLLASALATCCARSAPPSQFPNAGAAIERMRGTLACNRALSGEASLDYFGDEGRLKAQALYVVAKPDRLRFDVMSPLGGVLSTATSDGQEFSLLDVREKVFWSGEASECNVERALKVPIPPAALGQLLSGEAPILVHTSEQAQLSWDSGSYRLQIASEYDAREEVRLLPHDADWNRPWAEQRVRVLEVRVWQKGYLLYEVALSEHERAAMATPREDPEGIEPPVPPSGPVCSAEVPRNIRFRVPGAGRDVVFLQKQVRHNPPLVPELFRQSAPPGVAVKRSTCGGL